jgi:hypothetical protein
MIWVSIWVQIIAGTGVDYFQIGSFSTQEECQQSLQKAGVLVNNNNQEVLCLEVNVK